VYEFQPPSERGLDAVRAIKAMNDGTAKVFVPLGENFLSATLGRTRMMRWPSAE
jgi:hypothetical protein